MADHPWQPIVTVDGVVRFKENKLVSYLYNVLPKEQKHNLHESLASIFTREEWVQFNQLIGYSTCGFGDVYADHKDILKKLDKAEKRWEKSKS